MAKPQWYINCSKMAKQALDAAMDDKNRKLEFIPRQYTVEWKRWQLWWGHQVPAWCIKLEDNELKEHGTDNDNWIVARDEKEALAEANQRFSGKKFEIFQDPDVTRMVMLGIKLGGDVPFTKVYLHPMIRDAHGRKMSKSLGNVIDPLEPMAKPQWYINCSKMAKQTLDAAMDDKNRKLEFIPRQYTAEWKRWLDNPRDWCISRQLWWGHQVPAWCIKLEDNELKEHGTDNDNWIVARDEKEALAEANQRFAGKKFEIFQDPDVARMVMLGIKLGGDVPFTKVYLHPMIRDAHGRKMSKSLGNVIDPLEFCDLFIEAIKPYFAGDYLAFSSERRCAKDALWLCLETGLRLLHPFMPFLTEELWQRLLGARDLARKESIMMCEYPSPVEVI
ncbi:hypothetical protein SLEP1_g36514 [Rubroshorea leprosula]|uniref:valine--tRNA ligase n=1 Tax=Rubroshorea leprosula TaxID=152421 RepID=A0AAV5KRZ7_9ROSI|nr:hypothetical protein SLEP1_g36514 [Rubroshorea leprosula]